MISKGNVKVGNKYKDNYVQLAKPQDTHCLLFQPRVICAVSFFFFLLLLFYVDKDSRFSIAKAIVITNVGTK